MALLRMSARVLRERTTNSALVERLAERYRSELFRWPADGERNAWKNSLPALAEVLCDADLGEVEVLIEYQMPFSTLRADVVLAGTHPESGRPSYVVVELKQWSEAVLVPAAADLCLIGGSRNRALLHPVAQVRRYREYLEDFTALLNDGRNHVAGVAYLHNAQDRDVRELFGLTDGKAHLFTHTTRGELIQHLQNHLSPLAGAAEGDALLQSPFTPARQLMKAAADEIVDGGKFLLMDEQQVAASLVRRAADGSRAADRKEVIVVSGGPGSGKSLIALHLMSHFGRNGRNVLHATGSKSFTTTLQSVVRQRDPRTSKFFRYFLDFRNVEKNALDVLICDEAHRIRRYSGGSGSRSVHRSGRTQLEELIDAARVPVFLLDEHQVVRPDEMGSVGAIDEAAKARGCIVRHVSLDDQYRCGGSRAYERWVRRLLGLEPGGPVPWEPEPNFELLVADTPHQMESHLLSQQTAGYTARMTAGFCWRWSEPRSDGSLVDDVVIGGWRRPWNVKGNRSVGGAPPSTLWATESAGIGQIGCIYTAQGFEYSWNGTIFGPDLVWRGDRWQTVRSENKDLSLREATPEDFVRLIRNTYKVLLTRGLAGTVLFSTDAETQAMLRSLVAGTPLERGTAAPDPPACAWPASEG